MLDANETRLVYGYGDARAQNANSLSFLQADRVPQAIAARPGAIRGERRAPDMALRPAFRAVQRDGWFKVSDADGFDLASVYFLNPRAGDFTRNEARRIVSNVRSFRTSSKGTRND